MTIKKKKKLAVCILAVALLSLSGVTAFAGSFTYNNSLPALQGDIALVGGSARKDNASSTAAFNQIIVLGNNNHYATCWVDNTSSKGRVIATNRINCDYMTRTRLAYINGSNWTGSCELRGKASNFGVNTTKIGGNVDFG